MWHLICHCNITYQLKYVAHRLRREAWWLHCTQRASRLHIVSDSCRRFQYLHTCWIRPLSLGFNATHGKGPLTGGHEASFTTFLNIILKRLTSPSLQVNFCKLHPFQCCANVSDTLWFDLDPSMEVRALRLPSQMLCWPFAPCKIARQISTAQVFTRVMTHPTLVAIIT